MLNTQSPQYPEVHFLNSILQIYYTQGSLCDPGAVGDGRDDEERPPVRIEEEAAATSGFASHID